MREKQLSQITACDCVTYLLAGCGVQYCEVMSSDSDEAQYARRLCLVLLDRSIAVVRQWASAVPGFNQLLSHDQQLLFRTSLLEVLTLRLADRSETQSHTSLQLPLLSVTHAVSFCSFS